MKKILSLLTALTLTTSGVSSVVSCSNSGTSSGTNDKEKANSISKKLNGKTISFQEIKNNKKAIQYKSEIQTQLNVLVDQSVAYSFAFKDASEGNKILSKTSTPISIIIRVSDYNSDAININVKFSNISDKEKANSIATKLKNKTISFYQDGIYDKTRDYSRKIQINLNSIAEPSKLGYYSFDFTTVAEGNKTLSKTAINISIVIEVGNAKSSAININIKFIDWSDQKKANDISNKLENQTINFKQVGDDVFANKYESQILKGLKEKANDITTAFDFEFATSSEGDKTLSTTNTTLIQIKIKVDDFIHNAINIKVGFSDSSDVVKANNIAKKLKDQTYKFKQVGTNTKADQYNDAIQAKFNGIVSQSLTAYSFVFATDADKNKEISITMVVSINIKIKVGTAKSDSIMINVQFTDKSDLVKANEIANALKNTKKQIEFQQIARNIKANKYKLEIENGLHGLVSTTTYGNYGFNFKNSSQANKNLSKNYVAITIHIQVGGAISDIDVIINVKFSDSSDEIKADNIANQFNGKEYEFDQVGTNLQANYYKSQIQLALNNQIPQTTPYIFIFDGSGGTTLSTTGATPISIKIKVGGAISSPVSIKIKFSKLSNQQIANDTSAALNNKSIEFIQNELNKKASDYKNAIQTALNAIVSQTTPNYTFEFNGSGDTILSKTERSISIIIKVDSATSNAINIKVKFSDWSDKQKANNIKDKIQNSNISVPSGTETDITNPIVRDKIRQALKTANPTLSNTDVTHITFSDGVLYPGFPMDVKADITIGAATVTKDITVILTPTDQQKADNIAQTLSWRLIHTINLDIDGTKQGFNDYKTKIQDELKTYLSATEQTYKYNLVYSGSEKITNLVKQYEVKIKVGNAISAYSFKIGITFKYKQFSNAVLPNDAYITVMKVIDNKVYIGTKNNLYISNDQTTYQVATGITSNAEINTIKKINGEIFVGTNKGIFKKDASDTGVAFTSITSDISRFEILTIVEFQNKIFVGTKNNGLWKSNDLQGINFSKETTFNSPITALTALNGNLYIGTNSKGLYKIHLTSNPIKINTISDGIKVTSISLIDANIYVTMGPGQGTGIYISKDNGLTWNALPGWEDKTNVNAITKINGNIYIGTGYGLYVKDGSYTAKYSLPNDVIDTITQINNKIYIGTYAGIYYNFL